MTNTLNSADNNGGLNDLTPAITSPSPWLQAAFSIPRVTGTVRVEGCDVNFFRWGDPKKPGIVMLHGFLAHARCWAFIAPYIASDYHVVAYDMSGMGDSGWRTDYNEDGRVRELLAVCEGTGLFNHPQKPKIIAHSYGARVATNAVTANPNAFSGLIICDLMVIRPTILAANAERFKPPGSQDPNRKNRIYPNLEAAKERFVLAPPQAVEHPELFDFMAYHSLKPVTGGWQWKFDPRVFAPAKNSTLDWGKIGEQVVAVPGRKVMIYGKESTLFNADSVSYIRELEVELKQPTMPIIEIPNARHHLMLDQPMAVLSTLRTVLALWP